MNHQNNNSGGSPRKPEQQTEPENALPEITLEQLPQSMKSAAERAGWKSLMPVQAKAIPYVLEGVDLMVQSRTGSGKTGAFILPIIERIDSRRKECQAVVLAPTRELASQVAREADMLAGDSSVRTVAVYGGTSYKPQIDAFRAGAHVVIGTPGRILDHLMRGTLSLDGLEILVFDEADRMLSMGFYPDMREIQRYLPRKRIHAFMFSATFPPRVMRLAGQFLKQPGFLSLSRDHVHVAETEHVFYTCPPMDKDRSLIRIIEIENPVSAIIFCNTRASVDYVTAVLQRFGYDADKLSSDLSQSAREKVLNRVRSGKLRFLVATDVAARGIDIPELSHVFVYEPPEDPEAYIHRAGRTGRAGATGTAISLISSVETMDLKQIARKFKIDIVERDLPTEEDVQKVVSERTTALLEARLRKRDKLKVERMQRFIPLAKALGENEDEVKLMAMLLDDYYQKEVQSPSPVEEEQPQPGRSRKKPSKGKGRSGRRRRKS